MTTRAVRACYVAWVAVLTTLYYAFPDAHLYTWAAIGYSGAGAVLVGVRLNDPARRLPWFLVSAALFCFTTGDSVYNLILKLGTTPAFPGPADVLYLLVYPLLTAGFLIMVRIRAGGADNRDALIDALVPTAGVALLSWVYWIAPFTRAGELSVLQKLVSITYPVGDVLVLAMMLRMLTAGRRPRSLSAVGIAMVGLLISDIFYGQSQLNSAWSLGGPVDFGWVVFYATMGFAALMPSMRDLTSAAPPADHEAGSQPIIWMALAALIAPAVLYAEYLHDDSRPGGYTGGVVDAPVIAAAAAIMFLLVLLRVNGLVIGQRRARERERSLREASALLFSAATIEEAGAAVRQAVGTLMPPDTAYRMTMSTLPASENRRAEVRLITAADLPPGTRADGFEHFLYATLPLAGRTPKVAVGLIAAPERLLRELQPSFETLFAQIDVVVERISLTGEVNRRDSEAYFRTLIQNASDVILIIDEDDLIKYASPSAAAVFGHPDLVGTPLSALVTVGHHAALHGLLGRLRSGRGAPDTDLSVACADGRLLQVDCAARDLRDDTTVGGLVLTLRDVTQQRRLENDLSHQAFHDGLTGLANRALFRNRLEQAFRAAERDGTELAVLFVDLDDFKEVNDTLGHAVGDQLLVAVSERLAAIIGHAGTAARMGGDEFAVMLERDADQADTLAERIVTALAAAVEVSDGIGGSHNVSGAASVGVATNGDARSATELLRHADLALYQAKGEEKGTWQRFRSELHTAMVERLETRLALHEAIEARQFRVQYQPIVDMRTGAVTGVESLVRWQHPGRGLLAPYHFIEIAEESGAIVGIGSWVLREALSQIVRWRTEYPDTTVHYVSVNVSARQFRTEGFVDLVRRALAETGARPEWLLLEITESLVLRDADQVWNDLRTLRALGVRIAIDDFGTGYSSLSYLREMPVDVLKLDKSFIDDILASEQQRALVDAIVTLARNLDLAVVAEGIEDNGQRAALAGMGCPYGQGFLFSQPVWPDEITRLASGLAGSAR